MTIYWIMLLAPIVLLFIIGNRPLPLSVWIVIGLVYAVIIGFRHEVGCDWFRYLEKYYEVKMYDAITAARIGEPGYVFLNWLSAQFDGGIYGVNFMGAAIFMAGAITFCRIQPSPLLSFVIMVPYLMIVTVMGYARQGIALGFVFWALAVFIRDQALIRALGLLLLASLFHKSSLIVAPVILLASNFGGGILVKIGISVIMLPILLYFLGGEQYIAMQVGIYVEQHSMESAGAIERVFMNVLPAAVLLWYRRQFKAIWPQDYTLWFMMAIAALASLALLYIQFVSTVVDRAALYFSAIQVVVWSRLFYLFGNQFERALVAFLVVLYYLAVWFVWSTYASFSFCWNPYHNALLLDEEVLTSGERVTNWDKANLDWVYKRTGKIPE
jgi:hypothetical protein